MLKRSFAARLLAIVLALTTVVYAVQNTAPTLPDPGDTGVSKEDQEKVGLQAMAEVYKQMPVLPDSNPVSQYVQQLGKKLATVIPQQYSWPYQFHVVQESDINAFALPGGPIFVNVGTINAADNEAELAGVMAHEMSHVYMQHSIKQMKKAQLTQGIAGLLGGLAGAIGGTVGGLAQAGIQIGGGVVMMKYSRGDEAQADAVGAIIMYRAGYNPRAMPEFFQKLEQQGGGGGPQFLSDHPNPGNRVQAVSKEIASWPPKNYVTTSTSFQSAKQRAQGIKAYSAQQIADGAKSGMWAQQNQRNGSMPKNLPVSQSNGESGVAGRGDIANVSYQQVKPSGNFKQLPQNNILSMTFPDNWQASADQNGGGLTIAPPAGVGQGSIAYGVVINGGNDPNAGSLDQATQDLIRSLQQSNPGLTVNGNPQSIRVNGVQGRSVDLTGTSPVQQNGQPARERDWLVTLPRPQGGLLYMIFIAPENSFNQLRPTYEKMLKSVQLKG